MTLRIFSQEEWKTLYSDADYKTERGKAYLLHFLIARNPKEDVLIERIKNASLALIAADDSDHHQLTPLIIATMKGTTRIVEELLLNPMVRAHINDRDAYGWTPLHHAALASEEIYQKLLARGANPNCRTNLNATPQELKDLVTWGVKAPSLEHVSFEGKPLDEETAKARFQMTSYRDIPYFPPEKLQPLWQEKKPQVEPIANQIIQRRRHESPKLVISPVDAEKGFYELLAGEAIPAGTVIGEYGGAYLEDSKGFNTFSPERAKKYAYFFKGFDAREVGNATRFMNCGFSNVAPYPFLENGVVKTLFVAHQPIQKGEPIVYNYGGKAYDVSYGPQILFNRDKMHAFFNKGLTAILAENVGIDGQLMNSKTRDQVLDLYLKRAELRDHMVFPLGNPLAIIDLHISKTVPAKEWSKALFHLEHPAIHEWASQQGLLAYSLIWQLTLRLAKIDRTIQTKAKERYPLFQKWVQERCQTITIMNLMKGMEWFEEGRIEGIDERLQAYDWQQDPASFFGYESRKRAFEQYINFTTLRSAPDNFAAQRSALIDSMETDAIQASKGLKAGYQGSEIEKMIKKIKETPPNLAKVAQEFAEMGYLLS